MLIGPLETRFSPETVIARRRLLPVPGEVLAHVGDRVKADDIVAQAPIEGQLYTLDVAEALGASIHTAPRYLRVREGDAVKAGDVLASKGALWLRPKQVIAPCAGTVQRITEGCIFLRQEPQKLQLRAYLPGEVTEQYPHRGVAIRAVGALVRGAWGSGGPVQGLVATMVGKPSDVLTWERVGLRYRGTLVVGGILDNPQVLYRAKRFRIHGLIVGSITPDLRPLCAWLDLPIVVTEGIGHIPMAEPLFEVLRARHGCLAVLSGAERSEAGPEVIIPLPKEDVATALVAVRPLALGAQVRITRPPYLGVIAQVTALPNAPQETIIGTRVEGAEVRLPDGRKVFVPYVNMELLA